MFPSLLLFFFIFSSFSPPIESLRILIIAPGWSNSHILFNYRLSKMLIDHDHNVTLLLPLFHDGKNVALSRPNGMDEIRIQILQKSSIDKDAMLNALQRMAFVNSNTILTFFSVSLGFRKSTPAVVNRIFDDHNLLNDLSNRNFNLVLTHPFQLWPIGLAHRLGIENVAVVAPGAFLLDCIHTAMALPAIPSLVPNVYAPSSDRMSFGERMENTILRISNMGMTAWNDMSSDSEQSIFRYPPYHADPNLWTVAQNIKGIFINGEVSLDIGRPQVPGMFYLGDIEEKTHRPLSEEWREIVEPSKSGVVIFSFGTIANTSVMPVQMKEAFYHAFTTFPDYTILWRLEGEIPIDLEHYPNIKIVNWMPQRDLLFHPKTKLFITHGGYNSFLESCDAGVPMVLVPLFADQHANAKKAAQLGVGLVLDKSSISSDQVEHAMRTMLTNSSFCTKARLLSSIHRDSIRDNRLLAVRRIEKLTSGNRMWPGMKAAQRLNFVQYLCLDVIAFLSVVFLLSLSILSVLLRQVWYIMNGHK